MEYLQDILPTSTSYEYKIIDFSKISEQTFHTTIRANIFSKEAAEAWLEDFESQNKKDYRCHHNTRASLPSSKTKTPSSKHVNCQASLKITVKQYKMKRSQDDLLKTHPCEIVIKHNHNHLLECADALRHRRPTKETEEKILNLFSKGHSPSSALDLLKYDLQEEYGDNYYRIAADGALCPNLQWVFNKYYTTFNKEYGASDGIEMIKSLQHFIEVYNLKCKDECAKLFYNETDNEVIIAICTPLMKRVHENLKSSSEMMFVDASGSMDRHCSRIFTFLSPSLAGALPLGLLILFSESEKAITQGLTVLRTILPKNGFFGQMYPLIIMTDDSKSERNSLHSAFPESKLLLCKFHVLQAFWRFLLNAKNQVKRCDAPVIFNLFKRLFNCTTVNDVNVMYDNIIKNDLVKQYSNLITYIKSIYSRADEWVPAFVLDYKTRGHFTNNLSESNFRTIKDKIMNRIKAYSVVQLFDFMTTRYESFFERKLADFLNNKSVNYTKSRYNIPITKTNGLLITKLSEDIFLVKNTAKQTEYQVNMFIEDCSCPVGIQGAPCKHQLAVAVKFNLNHNYLLLKENRSIKILMHKILTGSSENLPEGWYNNVDNMTVKPSNVKITNSFLPNNEILNDQPDDNHNTEPQIEPDDEEKIINITHNLQQIFDKLLQDIKEDSQVLEASEKFIENFNKIKTKSALVSSLHTFGKHQFYSSKKMNTIKVQPTSLARRKVYLGGRRQQHTGRPAKRHFTPEHGYSNASAKDAGQPQWLVPLKRRKTTAAPHSLSHCVEQNISLGKSH
ncbi:uncharacterized protein LOC115889529 isoform X2 [Sitophilus oryzae]|uniref:Uncharacterized protein LOC115889529 isoform X2 n=1 Tax=Sitophilus oryzae TaxID=7048 RepID=A0A6J2YRK9_SITOR|nr:uncharacterized protein LOC115889529 isoform X2 [Sitophilus oryzae]